jgi:type IV fimbrial biogenesis protein FimT
MPIPALQVMHTLSSIKRRAAGHMSGFTIVELMITVGVASILLAVAVPSFNQLMVTNRLTTQANDFVSAINFARSEAIKRNASVSLCRVGSATGTTCATSAGNWSNWIVTPGGGNVVRRGVVNTTGGIVVQSTLGSDQLMFGPEGLARSAGLIVTNQRISVCATRDRQGRRVVLGSGSRLSTEYFTGACTP